MLDAAIDLPLGDARPATSHSTSRAARSSRCSGPTAPARRPRCGPSPGSPRSTRGRIELDGERSTIPAPAPSSPPHERPIGVVFQDHSAVPRISACSTTWRSGCGPQGVGRRTPSPGHGLARSVRPRRPRRGRGRPTLSGGQAQRVALGPRAGHRPPSAAARRAPRRARCPDPDPRARASCATTSPSFGGARLLVTHDPVDAVVLADHGSSSSRTAGSPRRAPRPR